MAVKHTLDLHPLATLQVDIVSAEKAIFSGRVKMLIASGESGELGILPGHAQLLTTLKPGHIRVVNADETEEYYYVSGGFLEVQPDAVTVLADVVSRADQIDEQRALEAKTRAEKILASKQFDHYTTALSELSRALAQIRVLHQWQKHK